MKMLLVANGPVTDDSVLVEQIEKADRVIAIDGGMSHLIRVGHQPELWVGDMDSFDFNLEAAPWLSSVEILRYPPEKDASDTELAIDIALKFSPSQIVMMGMLGARVDHTLANLSLMKLIHMRGIKTSIVDADQTVYYMTGSIKLENMMGKTISISPITDLKGVTITGCHYPLYQHNVAKTSSLGLSNKAVEDVVTYVVESGEAFVVVSDGK
ncbi:MULTISPECIES: thiamine diphosphokinase [unclassified Fusibacter]|uniref:thiamine diphosphokinase n=1 Tax=unclassified Fusibacter TaxID=2624464 RepID=UPI0010115C1E|nr:MULTISPECIES: thiamine diphosphokinase [unclassified Fusibacter]MCK8058060.1 thiamine diphosphokinase [Fusibacter sp. A2]NPE20642.1 thiamine diphosphokinase [Fusibacter sp. A1]RXV62849.1 thiamine diphosphokinase [Fusibacter sp. A1]